MGLMACRMKKKAPKVQSASTQGANGGRRAGRTASFVWLRQADLKGSNRQTVTLYAQVGEKMFGKGFEKLGSTSEH